MKVSLNWLKDYVDVNVDTKTFADVLTATGTKAEGFEVLYKQAHYLPYMTSMNHKE